MRIRPATACACLLGALPSTVWAQTAFDGFRLGAEAVLSDTALRVDARRPRDAAITEGQARLGAGEAALGAARAQIGAERASYLAAQGMMARHQAQLGSLMQQPAATPAEMQRRTAATEPLRDGLVREGAALGQQAAHLAEAAQAADAAQARLDAGRFQMLDMARRPAVVTDHMHGLSTRLSAGWGKSFGPLHLGVEADLTPQRGKATVHILGRRDRQVEAGFGMGLSGRAGWILAPWVMPYLSLGGEGTAWAVMRGARRRDEWLPALRAGAGVEAVLADRLLLRLGYDRSVTPEIGFSGARVSPGVNTVRVGLVRTF